jgi:hypothetical protein
MKKIPLFLAGLFLLTLNGCGGSPGGLNAGTICRSPEAVTSSLMDDPNVDAGWGDFRCADLRETDFSGLLDDLFACDFDTKTQWPANLPEDFDPAALMELGKDPGLGVRALHAQGITGKGVGIAIIDQALLVDHQEYGDRLRLYQEYHSAAKDSASMHGPAVASIALGETVGVAPEALLYYIADDLGTGTEKNFVRDMSYYAADIDRFIQLNETLSDGEKIRVISMSVGYMPDTKGAEEMDAAIQRARAAGIAVVWVGSHDPLMEPWMGMGRRRYGDSNNRGDFRLGAFWNDLLFSGEFRGADGSLLLVPMDRRTTASPAGPSEYAYFSEGGTSWTVPWIAGLYALACQVKPDVTFAEFLDAAQATAEPISIWRSETEEFPYGKTVNPAALLEELNT